MPVIRISPAWELGPPGESALDARALLALLSAVQDTGGIAQAARSVGLSYRNAWGRIKAAEALFGSPLIHAGRGRGSTLTTLGDKLVWADRRILARLTPQLESLASEIQNEIDRVLPRQAPALRLHASHGFAVAELMEHVKTARMPIELRYRNSFESVGALSRDECDLAGFHVPLGRFQAPAVERYSPWLRPGEHRLVHLATRTQGLFVAPGNPKRIRGIADLRRPELRFVNRPEGSGTRMLTELLLAQAGIRPQEVNGFDSAEFTHAAVAAFIASGMADVGIGVQTAAMRFGLRFLPLLQERYFFAFRAASAEQPAMQGVLQLLRSPALKRSLSALEGYDAAETGRLLDVQEAFAG
ncbi:substrate-binding domain-containing protein [Piscinibacter sp. XHJ-5]|uniref:helix-turn-helix transcriptional regulator n=1 Tax=Piscinibacter sp. XHJ-5 TaxID=3037797 RepID=UPI002453341E|nr:substrate-binding domain-containing protein [Piscinibacter sp. XHJ-5]